MAELIDCPDGGRCGTPRHWDNQRPYQRCLAKTQEQPKQQEQAEQSATHKVSVAALSPESRSAEALQEPKASEFAAAAKPSETVKEPQSTSQPTRIASQPAQSTAQPAESGQGTATGTLLWAILVLQLLTLILVFLIAFVF